MEAKLQNSIGRWVVVGVFALSSSTPLVAAEPVNSDKTSATAGNPGKTSSPQPVLPGPLKPEDIEFFEKQIRPLLIQNCTSCHGAEKQKGGLRLDSHAAAIKGGDSGTAFEPGKPDVSLLIEAVGYGGDYKMPPKGKLPAEQIAALTEWVRRGAPWPVEKAAPTAAKKEPFDLAARRAKQWCFQPLMLGPPPVIDGAPDASVVDRFILARLSAAGLKPAKPADKRTLIRRVTYDLVGLPPTPGEIDAFLADDSAQAFERVVDRLLASPHYGERGARHWLDLVRYAETRGHEFDFEAPHASEYRDYVIRALNADLPYNRFVVENIAGDLLLEPRRHPTEGFNESIIGTGSFFLGEAKHSPVDIRGDEAERVDNQIDVFTKAFLGMTVGCARCHDHKFDAISTKDYYALAGFLQSSRYQVACVDRPDANRAAVAGLSQVRDQRLGLLKQVAGDLSKAEVLDVPRYLLASLELAGSGESKSASIVDVAKKFQVDGAELEKWIGFLRETAAKSEDNPFYLWGVLAAKRANVTPEILATARAELLNRARNREVAAIAALGQAIVYEDFGRGSYSGWYVTGDAFAAAPLSTPHLALKQHPTPIGGPVVGKGIAHSGALSNELQGVLRSETFTIEKNRILYHMAGTGAKVSLIIDGYQLIQNPIYGGLKIELNNVDRLAWHVQDVNKWVGHKAYIEFMDAGPGWIAADQILFADGGPPPAPPNTLLMRLLEDPGLKSTEMLAQAYGDLLRDTARNWSAGQVDVAPAGIDREAILDWMFDQDLAGTLRHALPLRKASLEAKLAAFGESQQKLQSAIRYSRKAMALADGTPEEERVHLRGSHKILGEPVPRRLPEAIAGSDQPPPQQGSGRLEMAERLVDPANPLLSRVIVNRIWAHHFGEGIVYTPDDFGNMGQPPTHPELLDYLAAEFMREGWSFKKLHKMLLLTRTYQMSSRPEDPLAEGTDPSNKLWHRMPIRRLEAEVIRDAMLAVSGRLSPDMFGPSVLPYLTDFMVGRGRPASGPLDGNGRRSIYIGVRRNFLMPMFLAFDFPIPFSTMGRRSSSNVPAQALALMNNPFVVEQAGLWAKRVTAANADPAARVAAMYVAAFGRPPDRDEVDSALAFVAEQKQQYGSDGELRVWTDFAHVLFNVKEFIFIN